MSEQENSPIDKTTLKPAEENPWYVLATICNKDLIMPVDGTIRGAAEFLAFLDRYRSKDIWNAWAFSKLGDEQKATLRDERPDLTEHLSEWDEISEDINEKIEKRCGRSLPSLLHGIEFSEVDFVEDIQFANFIFPSKVSFNKAKFSGTANFNNAVFFDNVVFEDTSFLKETAFGKVISSKVCVFKKTRFSEHAFFDDAKFNDIRFISTAFDRYLFFRRIRVNQNSCFVDCDFPKSCSLREARFEKGYPILEGTILAENTLITAKEEYWPDPKKCEQSPEEARASCEVLRHTLNNQGLPEQAHFFFRREMQFAGRIGSLWQRLPYKLFGWLSNYGYSIYRPVFGLIALWLGFASVYKVFSSLTFTESLGLSIASLFQFTGWQRVYFSEVMADIPVWLKILAGFQTIAGIVLLFLLGLGLRNRFRFK